MQTFFQKMAEKDVYITGEVLDLFWDCLKDEDILDNEFQEQIENDLEEVNKLKKTCYFGELLLCSLLCEKSCLFSFLSFFLFQILICPCFEV